MSAARHHRQRVVCQHDCCQGKSLVGVRGLVLSGLVFSSSLVHLRMYLRQAMALGTGHVTLVGCRDVELDAKATELIT